MVGDSTKSSTHCDSCMDNEKLLAHIRDTMRQEMTILSDQFKVLFIEFEEQKQLLQQMLRTESSSSLGDGDESPFRQGVRPRDASQKHPNIINKVFQVKRDVYEQIQPCLGTA